MLQAQTQKQYIARKNPFANHFNPYQQYKMKLQNNAYLLRNQFPSQSLAKIKELLEELDNNVQMAKEILEEQCGKSCSLESEKFVKPKMQQNEENKVLRKAVAQLYKKLMIIEKEVEAQKIQNQQLRKDNKSLRLHNTLMMNNEFRNNQYDANSDVY